jgi:hypothetical protein
MSKELLTQIIQKAMRQQINPLIFEEVRIEQSALFDLLWEAFQVLGFTATDISSDIRADRWRSPLRSMNSSGGYARQPLD